MNHPESKKAGAGESADRGSQWIECPRCELRLQIDIRFGDDRFRCPRCSETFAADRLHDRARQSPPFDSSAVVRDIVMAATMSLAVIGIPILFIDAMPSLWASVTRRSAVFLIAWFTSSFPRIILLMLLAPQPGILAALVVSPFLHRYPVRWRRTFRCGFLIAGPIAAISTGFIGAGYHVWRSGEVPYYFVTGTMSVWLGTGYLAGTLIAVYWSWRRSAPIISHEQICAAEIN